MGETQFETTKKRIVTIDVLRGFALVGILYAHMIIWYTGASLPPDVYFKYDSLADGLAFGIFGAFVFAKFFSVFSFLFGLSFYLHFRKHHKEPNYFKIYIWRLFLLFLIGLGHHIIWRGDILAIYAILGVLLLPFRRLPAKMILLISLLLITNIPIHLYEILTTTNPDPNVDFPMEERAQQYYVLVQHGDFLNVLKENWASWPAKIEYQLESGRLLMTFGYFLLGLYTGRTNLFVDIEKNFQKLLKWNQIMEKSILSILLLGLLMLLKDYVTLPRIRVVPEYKQAANFLFSIYNVCITIFYLTGISIILRNRILFSLLKPLAHLGKMALTNYLLQTFFGLLLFYEFGLDLFDKTSPAMNVLLALGVLYLQVKFSQYWLERFQQGPVEWLWKSLTNFRFSSLKKKERNQRQISQDKIFKEK